VDVSKIPALEPAWTRSLPDFTRRNAGHYATVTDLDTGDSSRAADPGTTRP
jgi:hypothetical protein